MKLAGLLLLLAGWVLMLTAIALLASAASRGVFAFCGFGVETLGLVVLFRGHFVRHGDSE